NGARDSCIRKSLRHPSLLTRDSCIRKSLKNPSLLRGETRMAASICCPTCQSPEVIRKGTTPTGIQKYQCGNPTCRKYFRAAYYQPPFLTRADYMRAYYRGTHHGRGGRRIPVARIQRAQLALRALAPVEALLALSYPARVIGACLMIHADCTAPDLYA